mgnify:CR=1 FL=1
MKNEKMIWNGKEVEVAWKVDNEYTQIVFDNGDHMDVKTSELTKRLYDMTKKELLVEIEKLHKHLQPRWKNRGTKDELLGLLLMAQQLELLKKGGDSQ